MDKTKVFQEISRLRQEHVYIQRKCEEFAGRILKGETLGDSEIRGLLEYLRDHHHHEEQELFPWLANQSFLSKGGPKCTHFMGLRMLGGVVKGVDYWCEKLGVKRPDWLPQSSPLEIPMEEHRQGEYLAAEIQKLLDKSDVRSAQFVFLDWIELVKIHRQKEDDCLFMLIARELGDSPRTS